MKILWIVPYPVWPANFGGAIRVASLLRAVLEHGHEVELWCRVDEAEMRPAEPPIWASRVKVMPFRGRSRSVANKVRGQLQALPPWAFYCLDSALTRRLAGPDLGVDAVVLSQAAVGGYARLLWGRIPVILDAHNVESDLDRQIALRQSRPILRAKALRDARRMGRLEDELFARADLVVAVSEADAERIRTLTKGGASVAVHRSGVDTEYFQFVDHARPHGARLVMTGHFGYLPNQDAGEWLASEILPALRQMAPAATVTLVGKGPSASVLALHNPLAGVFVTGEVPDVRPHLSEADVFVVPIRVGGGTRLKVVEALAAGLPVVGTSRGLEGLDVEDREIALIAETTDGLVAAVCAVLHDREKRRQLVNDGRQAAVDEFDWAQIGRGFVSSLEAAVRPKIS